MKRIDCLNNNNYNMNQESFEKEAKSKLSNSYSNLTDNLNQHSVDSMTKHLMHDFQITDTNEDNLDKYFNSNHLEEFTSSNRNENMRDQFKIENDHENNNNSDNHSEDNDEEQFEGLDKFYERKQSIIEKTILRKASLNSFKGRGSLNITPKSSSQGVLNYETNQKKSKSNMNSKTVTPNKTLNARNFVSNEKENGYKFFTYDQFKLDSTNKKTSKNKNIQSNNNSNKNLNSKNVTNTKKQRSKSTEKPPSSSRNLTKKEKPTIQLKITHDNVEDITQKNPEPAKHHKLNVNKNNINRDSKNSYKNIFNKKKTMNEKSHNIQKNTSRTNYNLNHNNKRKSDLNIQDEENQINNLKTNESLTVNNKGNTNITMTNSNNNINKVISPATLSNASLRDSETIYDRGNYLRFNTQEDKAVDILNPFLVRDKIKRNTVTFTNIPKLGEIDEGIIKSFPIDKELLVSNIHEQSNEIEQNLNTEKDNKNLERTLLKKYSWIHVVDNLIPNTKGDAISSKPELHRKMTIQSDVMKTTKCNIDENYAKDLQQVYIKRKATGLSNPPEQIEDKKSLTQFFKRNLNWKRNVTSKSLQLKDQMKNIEMEECSFAPKITKYTKKILSKSMNHGQFQGDDFYHRNMKWKQTIEKFRQNQHLINERKQYEECHFKPLTNKVRDVAHVSVEKKMDDYIYRKNLQWLNKVNENRKLKDLEYQEDLKNNAKHETIRERMTKSNSQKNINQNSHFNTHKREASEDKLKKDLTSEVTSQIVRAPNLNFDNFPSNYREVGNQMKEIKNLISSLKDTLNENKNLINLRQFKTEINRSNSNNLININESYNINIETPKSSTFNSFRKNYSHCQLKFRNFNQQQTQKKSYNDSEEKFNLLIKKYMKEKSGKDVVKIKH